MKQARRKQRKKIYDPRVWPTWMLISMAWLIARLPIPAIVWLGKWAGGLVYRFGRSRRHITLVNIGRCFPELSEQQRTALARNSINNTAIGALETVMTWLNPRRDISKRISVHGLDNLQAAKAKGKGVVLVGGHFSAMDIISQGMIQADIDVMYRENKNPAWEWLQVSGRRRFFKNVIEREDTRATLRKLKAGRAIWYAADQDYGRKHSVFAPFFGIATATINGTARLARFNDSPVIFMSNYRNLSNLTWSIHFSEEVEGFPSGDDIADATHINSIIEQAIREHPEQYLWMHRRFKTRPDGESSFY